MKKISWLFLVFTLAIINLSAVSFAVGQKNIKRNDKFRLSENAIPNQYIVVLNDEVVEINDFLPAFFKNEVISSVSKDLVSSYGGRIDKLYKSALQGYSVEMSRQAAERLSLDQRVKYVEEDFVVYKEETQTNVIWNLDRIDQRNVPLDTYYNYSKTGAGVNAYVLDSGIRNTHVEFGGRVLFGADFVGDGQNGNDCDGHGTAVAGVLGSTTYGVAKQVTLHNVRVLGCSGTGAGSDILDAVEWVTDNHVKPAVVNMSLGSIRPSTSVETAITKSIAAGVSYALAAGNDNADACSHAPGGQTPNAVNVGATYLDDARSVYSNYGACVDIFAPGTAIISTLHTSDWAITSSSGTSMAAPHAAGVMAQFLQSNPAALPAEVKNSVISTATTGVLREVNTGSPNRLLFTDAGFAPPPPPAIIIPEGPMANPYPSTFTVSGQSGVIANTAESVRVKINGFSHTYPNDIGLVLVSPNGLALMIQGSSGGNSPVNNVSYTISDTGSTHIPTTSLINGETYKPTAQTRLPSFSGISNTYNNPGPVDGGTATFASTFNNIDPNGTWRLFISDFNQHSGDRGVITNWSLEFSTVAPTPDPVIAPPVGGRAGFIGYDSFTKGNWVNRYGAEGYYIIGGGGTTPAWFKSFYPDLRYHNWIGAETDERALLRSSFNSSRTIAALYSPTQIEIPFEFNDGRTHRLAFYSVDWDGKSRQQTFEVLDQDTGTVLDTRTISNFAGGKYLIWQMRGKFKVRIKNVGGNSPDAVYSAVFIDPLPTMPIPPPSDATPAKFIGLDSATKGDWVGKYGNEGKIIAGDTPITLPAWTNFKVIGSEPFSARVWANSTTDERALKKATNYNDRIGSSFYTSYNNLYNYSEYRMSFDITDGKTHRLAFYNWFYNLPGAPSQTFEIIDDTGTVIDRRTISKDNDAVYAIWEVKGKFTVYIKPDTNNNSAVISGVFLDPVSVKSRKRLRFF